MKNTLVAAFFFLFINGSLFAQENFVETSDVTHYWTAFDSIQKTNDFSKQLELINRFYISKGTPGLAAFIKARNYTDTLWVKNINAYPKFWASIRPGTLKVNESAKELDKQVKRFKKLYPELKPARIYFAIGGLNTGGTTLDDKVLIGSEIVTGNPLTDVSEFKGNWLKNVFAGQKQSNLVYLNLHEYVHTQQHGDSHNVLDHAICEGQCDFIAELVMGTPISTSYLTYGRAHADSIRTAFKKEMFTAAYNHWFYNGGSVAEKADMGYYVGYEICRGYYTKAKDKKQALSDLLKIDLGDTTAIEKILNGSGYFPEGYDKKSLVASYENNQPYITGISPIENNAVNVDAGLKELRINFSKPMGKGVSIDYPAKGKDHFPLKKLIGYENGNRTLVVALELVPGKEYGFIINSRSFQSEDGYALKDKAYPVSFKTKSNGE